MIILLGLLIYLAISVIAMTFFTYLDVKFSSSDRSLSNQDIIILSGIWPFSILALVILVIGKLCEILITCLRVYFQQNKE